MRITLRCCAPSYFCGSSTTRQLSRNASAVSEANGTTVRVSLDLGVRFRYSRLKEAGRGCGGRGVLWELNRFWTGSHCRKRSYSKSPLLMLIDILLLSSSEVIVTPNGQSVKTTQLGNSSDACVYTRGSVRRASGFVQTGFWELSMRFWTCGQRSGNYHAAAMLGP